MEALVGAMSLSLDDRSAWRRVKHRLDDAGKAMAVEVGKSLAKAVLQEVMGQVKARVGEHAGEGIKAFVQNFLGDSSQDLRRDLKTRSDASVVKMLVNLCDQVAAALDADVLVAIDECQRLSEEDQRILASIALSPPSRARVILAWSTADHRALDGLQRMKDAGAHEIVVAGLDQGQVREWLRRAHVDDSYVEQVHLLSAGYPVIVEGLVGQLTSGGSLDDYTPDIAFTQSLDDALARLSEEAHKGARMLSAFDDPPPETTIASYLGLDAVGWGVLRTSLTRENILSVDRNGQKWFHESRRNYLWERVLGEAERLAIGQQAYSALLELFLSDPTEYTPFAVPVSRLARYAGRSRSDNSQLDEIIELNADQLAVVASALELQIDANGAPTETALIYAHNAFGATRGGALDALPYLLERSLLTTNETARDDGTDAWISSTVSGELSDEASVVLHGCVQQVLGKALVHTLTDRIIHEHFERFRLESSLVISTTGRSDVIALLNSVDGYPLYRRNPLRRSYCPTLSMWVQYGNQPVSVIGIFNSPGDLNKAKRSSIAVDEMSYGRRVSVTRTFSELGGPVPAQRFFRAAYFATGRAIELYEDSHWSLKNPGPPLEPIQYAQRQLDIVSVLREHSSERESDVYSLRDARGLAVGQRDDTYYFVELRGKSRTVALSAEQIDIILDTSPFRFARLEQSLNLPAGMTTKSIHARTQPSGLVDDPVVRFLDELYTVGRQFNRYQQPQKISMKRGALTQLIRDAHIRDFALARTMSERVTIGEQRGHRPQHALRVAVYPGSTTTHPPKPPLVCYAMPIGEPTDVDVKFLNPKQAPTSSEGLYINAFGVEPAGQIYGSDSAVETIAGLLGYGPGEIVLA